LMRWRTIWSRSWMQRVVMEALAADPRRLLLGQGWGTFAESYSRHWRQVPGRRERTQTMLASGTHWDAHSGARFHPHDTLLETLSSLGISGAGLMMLWLVLPILHPRSRRRQ